jgi:hypothetical protein
MNLFDSRGWKIEEASVNRAAYKVRTISHLTAISPALKLTKVAQLNDSQGSNGATESQRIMHGRFLI